MSDRDWWIFAKIYITSRSVSKNMLRTHIVNKKFNIKQEKRKTTRIKKKKKTKKNQQRSEPKKMQQYTQNNSIFSFQ